MSLGHNDNTTTLVLQSETTWLLWGCASGIGWILHYWVKYANVICKITQNYTKKLLWITHLNKLGNTCGFLFFNFTFFLWFLLKSEWSMWPLNAFYIILGDEVMGTFKLMHKTWQDKVFFSSCLVCLLLIYHSRQRHLAAFCPIKHLTLLPIDRLYGSINSLSHTWGSLSRPVASHP